MPPPASPLASFFESLALPVTDCVFMLGLLGIGLAMVLGIGTRLAALAGVVMLGFMYAAVAPWVWGSLTRSSTSTWCTRSSSSSFP